MDLLDCRLHRIGIDDSGISWFIGRFLKGYPGVCA
jgi:hypothetical protein